jgi:hypothetical protein
VLPSCYSPKSAVLSRALSVAWVPNPASSRLGAWDWLKHLAAPVQLHLATSNAHPEAVSALLAAGASIRIRDNNKQTAVQLALPNQVGEPAPAAHHKSAKTG